jgi:predicted alpha/beta superfamily hydrolase
VIGYLERHEAFASTWVMPRNVDVWVPPQYNHGSLTRFPVVYMHDGQNLFNPALAFAGVDWAVHEAIDRLSYEGVIAGAIVVGIWNTPKRIPEYMPQKPLLQHGRPGVRDRFRRNFGEDPCSDDYLAFVVEELKPFIDQHYRTLPDPAHTVIMGSSMGGLISLYALCEYPEVFGRAGCLSTSWPIGGRLLMPYLDRHVPAVTSHRIYFDYGVEAHIGAYEHTQRQIDRQFLRRGYRYQESLLTERFPGASQSESAWRARVDVPLRFLLRHDGQKAVKIKYL